MAVSAPAVSSDPLYMSPYAGMPTDPNQAPTMPEWNQIYDPSTMSLAPQMAGMLNGVSLNEQPLQQLQANAESTSPSPWAQLQSQLSRQNTNQAASQAAGQTAGQTAQTEGNLAMSGGLSSGAREQAQLNGQNSGITAQQGIQNQGDQQQLQIGVQDAANKQQEMMALPGMETQAYEANLQPIQMMGQADAQDMAAQMANNQSLNQFNMGAYGNQASMYGANQTANAQQQTAQDTGGLFGGGGFLGLGSWLCSERGKIKKLTVRDKKLLAQLLRCGRVVDRNFTKWYLRSGQTLVSRCKLHDPEWVLKNVEFIDKVLAMLESGNTEGAFQFYRRHTIDLCHRYWLGCTDPVVVDDFEKTRWAA